jgi:hypothetical protein
MLINSRSAFVLNHNSFVYDFIVLIWQMKRILNRAAARAKIYLISLAAGVYDYLPGGGGAGGLLYKSEHTLTLSRGSVSVVVGKGGNGGTLV